MDPIWEEIAKYGSIAVVFFSMFKYVMGPVARGIFPSIKDSLSAIREVVGVYEKCYSKTIEERATVAIELGKAGKSKQEISDFLDAALPLPDKPELTIEKN